MTSLEKQYIGKQDEFINYLLKYLPGTSKRIEIFKGDIASLKQQIEQEDINDADIEAWAEEKYKTWTHKSWTRTFVKMHAVEAAKAALNGEIKYKDK